MRGVLRAVVQVGFAVTLTPLLQLHCAVRDIHELLDSTDDSFNVPRCYQHGLLLLLRRSYVVSFD
jgi:hypothetical protein